MWVRTALFTSLTSYRSWLIELVRVTARRLGLPVTLLGGAPDPYEQRMIKSATPTLRPLYQNRTWSLSFLRSLQSVSQQGWQLWYPFGGLTVLLWVDVREKL